jgi:subtilisin family serine protease
MQVPVRVVAIAAPAGPLETFTEPSPDRIDKAIKNQLDDEVLIMLGTSEQPGSRSQADVTASAVGGIISGGLSSEGIYQIRWPTAQDLAARILELENQPNVTSVDPSFVSPVAPEAIYKPIVAPQYDYPEWTWRYDQVNASPAWAQSTGSGVTVGIVDFGNVYAGSPDLGPITTLDPIAVPAAHATHVAGLACGKPYGGGMVGLAWGCPVVSSYPRGTGDAGFIEAMNRVAKSPGVRVINISVGWASGCAGQAMRNEIEEWVSHSRVFFRRSLERAGRDVVWTFSAGNNCMSGPSSPWAANLDLPNVLVVAAANSDGTLASFSNYDVPIAAPGGVVPTHPTGIDLHASCNGNDIQDHGICGLLSSTVVRCAAGYCPARGEMAGTSMAAPVVAGIAALVTAKHPSFTASEVGACITSAAGTGGVGSTGLPDGQPGGVYTHPALPYSGSPIPIVNAGAAAECATGIPTVQVVPMGPTSGPAGFGMRVSVPSCVRLDVAFDGASRYGLQANSPLTAFDVVTTPNFTNGQLTNGQHQISFACESSSGSTLWTSPGFSVTITGGPISLGLVSDTVVPGDELVYTSGPSQSVATCPTLAGVTLSELWLYLDAPDGLSVTANRFINMPDNAATEALTVPAGTPAGMYTALERCYYYNGIGQVGIFEFSFNYNGVTVAGGPSSSRAIVESSVASRRHTERGAAQGLKEVVGSSAISSPTTPREVVTSPSRP